MTTARHVYMADTDDPTIEEARRQPGFGKQRTESESPDCRASCLADQAKAFATLRAMLALRGFELDIVGDGEGGTAYMVHKWSMSRTLPSLTEVRAFAERAGASHG